jgi:hypothetical protein
MLSIPLDFKERNCLSNLLALHYLSGVNFTIYIDLPKYDALVFLAPRA